MNQRRVWAWAAGLLPVIGLLLLVAKAELAVRHGPTFRIPIRGYDPRDILHGQYLQYQFEFSWNGEDSCGGSPWPRPVPVVPRVNNDASAVAPGNDDAPATPPGINATPRIGAASDRALQNDCCLCVTRTLPNGFNPTVRHVNCGDTEHDCDGWIRVTDVTPPLRYFIPENRARELQRTLNDTITARPSIELTLPRGGKPAIKELYLGDRPWREALEK